MNELLMKKPVLLLPRELPKGFMKSLGDMAELRVADSIAALLTNSELTDAAEIFLTTAMDPVPSDLIDAFPASIKLIASIGVGTDHIDLAAATERGIQVSNTPVVTEDTADLTFALILACSRKLSICERLLRNEQWSRAQSQLGKRVRGKTLGIVGFGAIGQAVARRARGFDMEVIYYSPTRKRHVEVELGAQYTPDLKNLLESADIVSLNCELNQHTHHLINAHTLQQMKDDALLINTGRGPLVDETALIEALSDGLIGGAGLDVFEFEPKVSPELLQFENVTLLPHIGSASTECRQEMALCVMENIRSFLEKGFPINAV